ncbi:UNVERIFIED_CONTAM: hypothetical protein FKN15_070696 [Acipenser sinensis]
MVSRHVRQINQHSDTITAEGIRSEVLGNTDFEECRAVYQRSYWFQVFAYCCYGQELETHGNYEKGVCTKNLQINTISFCIKPICIGYMYWLLLKTDQGDYEYPNQPQSVKYQKNDRCPPPPQMLPERACEVPSCRSDSECERHKRCCYNGCIYACLESVQPPPVLDWLVQPKPRWLGGNGWLLDGPEEVLQAEACSTTEDGDEPLHCPTGYECHIISPGNPAAGIPNRGQCIKQRGNSVLDWLVQPKPRWLGGNGWLLDGPEEVLQAEACSTTEDGDEPLHCPTGYECHIISPGNPAAGIPNRGQCIKQRGNSDGRSLRHKYFKDYKDYLGKVHRNPEHMGLFTQATTD